MPEHKIGTREEWQVARDELGKLEAEQAERNEEITRTRRDLRWVRVEKCSEPGLRSVLGPPPRPEYENSSSDWPPGGL